MIKYFILSNSKLWDKFIRKLLYPAILGSLIYELTSVNDCNKIIFLLITAVFYILDDIFLSSIKFRYDKLNQKEDYDTIYRNPCKILIDFLVALVFMIMIYLIHNEEYMYLSGFALLIFIFAAFYFPQNEGITKYFIIAIILVLILNIIQILIFKCHKCNSLNIEYIFYSIIVIIYFLIMTIDYWKFVKTNIQIFH